MNKRPQVTGENKGPTDPFQYYRPIARVKAFVDDHYQENITLRRAAAIACLDHRYFSSYFHQKIGVPFSVWLRTVRVQKAATLLTEVDVTSCEAARMAGFGTVRTLERAFQQVLGVTPSRLRRSASETTKTD